MAKEIFINSGNPSGDSLNLLVKCCHELFSKLDNTELYDSILNVSSGIINDMKLCSLFVVDQETQQLKMAGFKRFDSNDISNLAINKLKEISFKAAQTGTKQVVKDETLDNSIGTIICLPLKAFNTIIGVINFYIAEPGQISLYNETILDIFAEQAAVAIHNTNFFQTALHIYEIAETKTKQVIILREIVEALSQQRSLSEILDVIAKESLDIVGHGDKVAFVMLIDKEKNMLETKAACGEMLREEHVNLSIPLSQRGIVTWVVKNAQYRIAKDVTCDPEYLKIFSETRSEVCIPLIFRNDVIGVIDIESSQINAFGDQDLELLQTLADNASVAVKIGELYEVRLKQLEALYNTGTKISSSLNLNEVLKTISKEALNAIGLPNRTLYVQILNEEKGILEIKVASGVNSERNYVGTQITIEKGISGWVVRNQQHYICPDVKIDPYYVEINPYINSELCVPIMFGGKVIGLINVESIEKNDFGENDVQLLTALANQAGVAIENARLSEGLANTQFQLNEAFELALIGETLAGLNHDIRTCISLISGEAQWIEQLYEEKKLSIEEIISTTKNIARYVERMERLTEDLSRKSQQAPLKFQKTYMADLIKEGVYLMANKASHYNIQIDADFPSLQFLAEVDAGRLKRVFINIIMNAIDAMPHGGVLKINAEKNEKYVEIKFEDTGKGIAENEINKVWDRFFTTKKEGTGLGLAICKRIVESDHNGRIRIESKLNKGTTVFVRLPIKQNEEMIGNE